MRALSFVNGKMKSRIQMIFDGKGKKKGNYQNIKIKFNGRKKNFIWSLRCFIHPSMRAQFQELCYKPLKLNSGWMPMAGINEFRNSMNSNDSMNNSMNNSNDSTNNSNDSSNNSNDSMNNSNEFRNSTNSNDSTNNSNDSSNNSSNNSVNNSNDSSNNSTNNSNNSTNNSNNSNDSSNNSSNNSVNNSNDSLNNNVNNSNNSSNNSNDSSNNTMNNTMNNSNDINNNNTNNSNRTQYLRVVFRDGYIRDFVYNCRNPEWVKDQFIMLDSVLNESKACKIKQFERYIKETHVQYHTRKNKNSKNKNSKNKNSRNEKKMCKIPRQWMTFVSECLYVWQQGGAMFVLHNNELYNEILSDNTISIEGRIKPLTNEIMNEFDSPISYYRPSVSLAAAYGIGNLEPSKNENNNDTIGTAIKTETTITHNNNNSNNNNNNIETITLGIENTNNNSDLEISMEMPPLMEEDDDDLDLEI